jgi:hypothetical protein
MKIIFMVLAVIASGSAEAANINKGNFELGGSFSMFEEYMGSGEDLLDQVRSWPLNIDAQYFFFDHFSAGLETSWWNYNSRFAIGPTATYYLPVSDRIAPFVMVSPFSYSWDLNASHYSYGMLSSGRLGTKFFLTDSVSIGPALEFQHNYEGDGNTLRLLGMFSIHL